MTIVEALQNRDELGDVRVTHADRWLVYSDGQWTVYRHGYRQKYTRTVGTYDNEADAVAALIDG